MITKNVTFIFVVRSRSDVDLKFLRLSDSIPCPGRIHRAFVSVPRNPFEVDPSLAQVFARCVEMLSV